MVKGKLVAVIDSGGAYNSLVEEEGMFSKTTSRFWHDAWVGCVDMSS
jgi:hypothetical protein